MKDLEDTRVESKNRQKMTLRGYYDSLPSSSHPKTEFVNDIAQRTGVSTATVRNWIAYGMRPNNPDHVQILSEVTGIPVEDLWNEG